MTSENGTSIQDAADKERREALIAQCANTTFTLASKVVEVRRLQQSLHRDIEATHRGGCEANDVHKAMVDILGDDEDLLTALDSIIAVELETVNREIIGRIADKLGVDPGRLGIISI